MTQNFDLYAKQSKVVRSLIAEKRRVEREKEQMTFLCLTLTAVLGFILILI